MDLPDDILARSTEEGARRVALARLEEAESAAGKLPGGEEGLHDFRVALRRLRSTLRSLRDELGSVKRRHLKRLGALQDATGAGRDAEVALAWLATQRPTLKPAQRRGADLLVQELEVQRGDLGELANDLRKRMTAAAEELRPRLLEWTRTVHLDDDEAPRFGHALALQLRDHAQRFAQRLDAIGPVADVAPSHAARLAGKRVRYLLEPWRKRVGGAEALLKELQELQTLLGDLHDTHVLRDLLATKLARAAVVHEELLRERARNPMDPDLRRAARRDPRPGLRQLEHLTSLRAHDLERQLAERWTPGAGTALLERAEGIARRLERAANTGREIERKFLLSRMPELPPDAEVVHIEQGWLPGGKLRERLRRETRGPRTRLRRSFKLGAGLSRVEIEEECDPQLFASLWPLTANCRISKVRHIVPAGAHTWEIDVFDDRDLVLAEVELTRAEEQPELPGWLEGCVVREVTEESGYTNLHLAETGTLGCAGNARNPVTAAL